MGSDSSTREALSLTVYNQNFGVVRERRQVSLGEGKVELAYRDVAAELQPETVHIKSTSDADALTVLEQNYRYDLLSPETLLEKYVGKTIKVYRYNEKLGQDEVKSAEVLAQQNGVVLRIDGQLTYDFKGRYSFPEVPANLVEKPTLVWLLESAAPKQSLEVTYMTSGLNWNADYVLVLAANDASCDLTGWVSLTNQSGMSFDNAELKLVAGDVQRIAPQPQAVRTKREMVAAMAQANAAQFTQQNLFEYHLYTLGRPTSVKNREKKQVSLLEAQGIAVKKRLVLQGNSSFFQPMIQPGPQEQKVSALLEFTNTKENKLGEPLPKGVIRVYKADQSGSKQFVGEDQIDHTARDEKLRIKLGQAFDVVAERKQLKTTQLGQCQNESSWEITLRNHKATAETVEIEEPTGGDFQVTASSHPPRKDSATKLVFEVAVPAHGETKVTYTVRTRWC